MRLTNTVDIGGKRGLQDLGASKYLIKLYQAVKVAFTRKAGGSFEKQPWCFVINGCLFTTGGNLSGEGGLRRTFDRTFDKVSYISSEFFEPVAGNIGGKLKFITWRSNGIQRNASGELHFPLNYHDCAKLSTLASASLALFPSLLQAGCKRVIYHAGCVPRLMNHPDDRCLHGDIFPSRRGAITSGRRTDATTLRDCLIFAFADHLFHIRSWLAITNTTFVGWSNLRRSANSSYTIISEKIQKGRRWWSLQFVSQSNLKKHAHRCHPKFTIPIYKFLRANNFHARKFGPIYIESSEIAILPSFILHRVPQRLHALPS